MRRARLLLLVIGHRVFNMMVIGRTNVACDTAKKLKKREELRLAHVASVPGST
jgi:hypothetical protein